MQTNNKSELTKNLIREKALIRGEERSLDIVKRVRSTLKIMEEELSKTQGERKLERKSVSSAEVSRRAGIHPTTLFGYKHRTLGEEVRDWVKLHKDAEEPEIGTVRRSTTERVEDWKNLYAALAQTHRDTELELLRATTEIDVLNSKILILEEENSKTKAIIATHIRDAKIGLKQV
ncbi:hypothetical protein IFU01_18050 [Oxalobacteraceae sp. CFBP 8763]|nr:hypothetical protein [Oxalobacteraceae sp. CFBP 8763]